MFFIIFHSKLVCHFLKMSFSFIVGPIHTTVPPAAVPYVLAIRLFTAIKESNGEKHKELEKYSLVMVLMMLVF